MVHQKRVWIIGLVLIIALSGCFREAEDSDVAPTQREVRLADVQEQQTQNAPTRTATLQPTATREPIPIVLSPTADKTLIVGGPPAEDSNTDAVAEVPTTIPTEAPTNTPLETDTPSPTIPTATPTITTVPPAVATVAPPSFGDTGISPTPSRTFTPTREVFAATPTEILPEDECIYLVQGGDTIFGIARDLDVTPDDLYTVNPELALNPDDLQVGQSIRIPGCVSENDVATFPPAQISVTPDVPPTSTTGDKIHVVESGDTLFGIALAYGVSVEDIVAANESLISENTPIFPGDEIIIPR